MLRDDLKTIHNNIIRGEILYNNKNDIERFWAMLTVIINNLSNKSYCIRFLNKILFYQ